MTWLSYPGRTNRTATAEAADLKSGLAREAGEHGLIPKRS